MTDVSKHTLSDQSFFVLLRSKKGEKKWGKLAKKKRSPTFKVKCFCASETIIIVTPTIQTNTHNPIFMGSSGCLEEIV